MPNASFHLSDRKLSRAVGEECERLGFEVSYDGSSVTLTKGPFNRYPIAELPLVVAEELVQRKGNATIADAVVLAGRIDPMLQPADSYADSPEDYTTAPASEGGWRLTKAVGATAILVGTAFAGYALAKELMPEMPSIVMDAGAEIFDEPVSHNDGRATEPHSYTAMLQGIIDLKKTPDSNINESLMKINSNIDGANQELKALDILSKDIANQTGYLYINPSYPLDAERISIMNNLTFDWNRVNQTLVGLELTTKGVKEAAVIFDNETFASREMKKYLDNAQKNFLIFEEISSSGNSTTRHPSIVDLNPLTKYFDNLKPVVSFMDIWNKDRFNETKTIAGWGGQKGGQYDSYFSEFDGIFYNLESEELISGINLIEQASSWIWNWRGPFSEPDASPPEISDISLSGKYFASGKPITVNIFSNDSGPKNIAGTGKIFLNISKDGRTVSNETLFPTVTSVTPLGIDSKVQSKANYTFYPDDPGYYSFEVRAKDNSGKESSLFFKNLPLTKDDEPPVFLSGPKFNGSLQVGNESMTFEAKVFDETSGLSHVDFFLTGDQNARERVNASNNQTVSFRIPQDKIGNYTLAVKAFDNLGNFAQKNISIKATSKTSFYTIDHSDIFPPVIADFNYSIEDGRHKFSVLAVDDRLVREVRLILDNKDTGERMFPVHGTYRSGLDTYDIFFSKGKISPGKHKARIWAEDIGGNNVTSEEYEIFVKPEEKSKIDEGTLFTVLIASVAVAPIVSGSMFYLMNRPRRRTIYRPPPSHTSLTFAEPPAPLSARNPESVTLPLPFKDEAPGKTKIPPKRVELPPRTPEETVLAIYPRIEEGNFMGAMELVRKALEFSQNFPEIKPQLSLLVNQAKGDSGFGRMLKEQGFISSCLRCSTVVSDEHDSCWNCGTKTQKGEKE